MFKGDRYALSEFFLQTYLLSHGFSTVHIDGKPFSKLQIIAFILVVINLFKIKLHIIEHILHVRFHHLFAFIKCNTISCDTINIINFIVALNVRIENLKDKIKSRF